MPAVHPLLSCCSFRIYQDQRQRNFKMRTWNSQITGYQEKPRSKRSVLTADRKNAFAPMQMWEKKDLLADIEVLEERRRICGSLSPSDERRIKQMQRFLG